MNKIILFLLGLKGYYVAKAALNRDLVNLIDLVVIGEDKNVDDDYSGPIRDLCVEKDVRYCFRKEFVSHKYISEKSIALAAGWRWLIKEEFELIIVFHDSLLPKYRGFNPLVTALLQRDKYIGVTAILANKEFDRGDIVRSLSASVDYPIKISKAVEIISELYYQLAQNIISNIKQGVALKPIPQDDSKASYSVWRDEDDYRINWSWSSDYICHFINCMGSPYKGASTTLDGELIRILDAEIYRDVDITNRDSGKVLFFDGSNPVVICGSGLLKINKATNESGDDILPFKRFRVRLR